MAYDVDMNNYHGKVSFQNNDMKTAYYIDAVSVLVLHYIFRIIK